MELEHNTFDGNNTNLDLTNLLLQNQKHAIIIENLESRLNVVESMQKNIQELTFTVRSLADSINRMTEEQEELGCRISKLENIPADRWKSMVGTGITVIISTITGGIITALISLFSNSIIP